MMKRLPVSFTAKQHEAIKKLAYLEGTSMADVVRAAVDEYIKARTKQLRDSDKKK